MVVPGATVAAAGETRRAAARPRTAGTTTPAQRRARGDLRVTMTRSLHFQRPLEPESEPRRAPRSPQALATVISTISPKRSRLAVASPNSWAPLVLSVLDRKRGTGRRISSPPG